MKPDQCMGSGLRNLRSKTSLNSIWLALRFVNTIGAVRAVSKPCGTGIPPEETMGSGSHACLSVFPPKKQRPPQVAAALSVVDLRSSLTRGSCYSRSHMFTGVSVASGWYHLEWPSQNVKLAPPL